jgi:hypothetical protein
MARHTPRRKNDGSFTKALILAIILVFSFFMYTRISKDGLPRQVLDIFDEGKVDFTKLEQYTGEQKDSIKAAIAGFWVYESDSAGPLHLRDRIELKDNGIAWRTIQYRVVFPAGESESLTHIQHAYCNPYAPAGESPGHMYAESRIIRQVYVYQNDTCYGQSHEDAIWELRADGTRFELKGRRYASYGDRDLAIFFPEGAIDLIDDITVEKCPVGVTVPIIMRGAIIAHARADTVAVRDSAWVAALGADYYTPLCLVPQFGAAAFSSDSAGPVFTARYEITWRGKPVGVEVEASKLGVSKSLLKALAKEIELWRFPPLAQKAPALPIEHSFRLN